MIHPCSPQSTVHSPQSTVHSPQSTVHSYKLVLLMFIAVFVYSCQNDDDTLTPETANTPPKITSHYKTTLTATEIKNNALLQSKFAQLQKSTAKAGANKTVSGFDIYKNKAQVVMHKYFTSYTFLVKRKPRNKNVVENYIINQYYDGSTTQFLVTYPLLGRKQLDTENATVTPLNGDPLIQLKTTAKTSSAFTVEYDYCAIREAIPCKGLDDNGEPVLHLPDSPICTLKGDPDRKPYWVCHGAWVIRINEPIGYNNDAPLADPCSADYKDYLEELIEKFGDRHDTSDISWFLDYLEDECERNTALNNDSTGSSTGGNSGSSGSGSSSGGAPPEPVVLESMINDVQDTLEDLTDADITFTKSDIETMETWYELESVAFDIVERIADLTEVYVELGGDADLGQEALNTLMKGNYSEAKAIISFMQQAITAINNGGSVYFKDKIIKDSSFVGTKADCVLEKLLTQTGYFKSVMDAFTNNNSKYKIRFEIKELSKQNAGGEGETYDPDENDIITIRIAPSVNINDALDIAATLLHEGVHAQLKRIKASGNKAEYNISNNLYRWLTIDLLDFWKDNTTYPSMVNTNVEHDFMSVRYVTKIAAAVRKFDSNRYSIENYMFFGWDGLFDIGQNRGLIKRFEYNHYRDLSKIPLNDNYKNPCD